MNLKHNNDQQTKSLLKSLLFVLDNILQLVHKLYIPSTMVAAEQFQRVIDGNSPDDVVMAHYQA